MSLGEWLLELSERVPGWTVVALAALLFTLLVAGRLLDLLETMATGVEQGVRSVNVTGNQTLGDYMPDYGYRELARWVWSVIVTALSAVIVLFAVVKVATAIVRRGEEW